jgi:hypothetical protein
MGYAMGIKQINGMFFPLIGQSPAQTGGFNGDSNALSNAFDQSNDNQFGDQLQTGMMLTMMMAMMSMIGMLMQLMTMLMGMLNGQNATGGGNNGFNLLNGGGPGGGNFFNPAGGPGGTMMLSNPGASGSGGFPGVAGGPGVSGTGPQTSVSSSPVATSFQVDPNAPVDAKRQSLINLAQQHIGQSESQFLGQYGGHAGAWCADFVSTMLKNTTGSPFGHQASVRNIYNWAQQNGRLTNTPKPGDLIMYNWSGQGTNGSWQQDHIGIVESVNADGTITVIGGNESGGVRRSTKRIGDPNIMGFADVLS